MELFDDKYSRRYPVELPFEAGFTKPCLTGHLPDDIAKIFPDKDIAHMRQEHGDKVLFIKDGGEYVCDGIFTDRPNIVLVVKTADCMPLIFYNEKKGIVGAVHMGWRSAEKGILENTGVNMEGFKVIAGPAMRKCCYEVGPEFASFLRVGPYIEERNGRACFDPVGFARSELMKRGLEERDFTDTGICSICSGMPLFSYRGAKDTGRTMSFITRRESRGDRQ